MKTKLLGWTLLFLLMLPIIPLFGQVLETNHVADKFDSVQSSVLPADQARAQFKATKAKAEKGDARGQCNLGNCYAIGQGVVKDNVEAAKWFRKAADQNDAEAQYNLGECYLDGEGVEVDDVEAVKWYRKAADQNYAPAQWMMGHLCHNNVEGAKWYRKAADQNYAPAQISLGDCYRDGQGVAQDLAEAVKWFRKAAEQNSAPVDVQVLLDDCYRRQSAANRLAKKFETTKAKAETGDAQAQCDLGDCYDLGRGVAEDVVEAVKWYRKAAEQNNAPAQFNLGGSYALGHGVAQDFVESVKWFRKAADQNDAQSQRWLGDCYRDGQGVPQDFVQAYKWYNIAAAQGDLMAFDNRDRITGSMTPGQIAEGQRISAAFVPRMEAPGSSSDNSTLSDNPIASGTGFFITENGYLVTNNHVVKDATKVRLVTRAGLIDAKVVQVDAANDLALLKVGGKFSPLPISSSQSAQLGSTVATVGFPDIGLQGFAPKLAKGEIASLSGAADDPRYFQISVPVQPGNSGGALVDEHGNVIGIVSAKLDASVALATSGALPENVNYAVKSSLLLSFLESVPDVGNKLKAPNTADRKFEDVVKSAQDAAVLVLVY